MRRISGNDESSLKMAKAYQPEMKNLAS